MDLKKKLKELGPCMWELPKGAKPGMRVPACLFLSEKLVRQVEDRAIEQIANVAFLPGIHKHAIALPDMHFGYGFPIGGVAALDYEEGGLSPGGIGFDINCGVRLLRTNLTVEDVRPHLEKLVLEIFHNVPCGVGRPGKIRLSVAQLKEVLEMGARWAVERGYGTERDLEHLEEKGCMKSASADKVSTKALQRGAPQLGSLGAGNHFLEIQQVDKIYQPHIARAFGIEREGQITLMIHTGSRGFGHQVCTDYLRILETRFHNLVRKLPDRQLVYAPAGTKECEDYFAAMSCAANFAWTNRQMITHWCRESIKRVLGGEEMGLEVVYDVAHNIGKVETHRVDGEKRRVYMHRKGATRAFGPGWEDVPAAHREVGQCVLIPGTMGTASYVLVGTKKAEEQTFCSVCHGAGRVLSRHQALKRIRGEQVRAQLTSRGIFVRSATWKCLAEEVPFAYHDVDEVVRACQTSGISRTVCRMVPLGVIKG
jgi:tRNA-splicing ligase RtcB